MENITRNVDELAAPQRKTIEDLLGQQLASNQQIFIMAFSPGTAADSDARDAARTRLQARLTQSQRSAESNDVTSQEADAAVEEAMDVLRPRPKS